MLPITCRRSRRRGQRARGRMRCAAAASQVREGAASMAGARCCTRCAAATSQRPACAHGKVSARAACVRAGMEKGVRVCVREPLPMHQRVSQMQRMQAARALSRTPASRTVLKHCLSGHKQHMPELRAPVRCSDKTSSHRRRELQSVSVFARIPVHRRGSRPCSGCPRRACMMARSRAQMRSSRPRSPGRMSRQSFSWYSAPQISSTLMVSSPSRIARTSIWAPSG